MDLIRHIQSFGFDVYARERFPTYVFYTDGKRIAYAQKGRFGGVSLSSEVIPHKDHGTGFGVIEDCTLLTRDLLERALSNPVPAWYHGTHPKPWPSPDAWHNKDSWNKGFAFYRDTPKEDPET